jgi:hypothetical protein
MSLNFYKFLGKKLNFEKLGFKNSIDNPQVGPKLMGATLKVV